MQDIAAPDLAGHNIAPFAPIFFIPEGGCVIITAKSAVIIGAFAEFRRDERPQVNATAFNMPVV